MYFVSIKAFAHLLRFVICMSDFHFIYSILLVVCSTVCQFIHQSIHPPPFIPIKTADRIHLRTGEKSSALSEIKRLRGTSAVFCFYLPFILPSRQKEKERWPGVKSTFHSPLTSHYTRSIPPLFTGSFLTSWESLMDLLKRDYISRRKMLTFLQERESASIRWLFVL